MTHNPATAGSNCTQQVANTIIFLILAIISIAYIQWTWTDVLGQFGGDNAWYLHMAKYLSPYTSPSNATVYFAQHSPYPSLIPIILALTGGGDSIQIAHLVTTLFLVGSFVLLYVLAALLIESRLIALGIVLIFATTSMTYMHALEILSENYYLFFCLLSIVLVEKTTRGEQKYGVLIMISLIVGATFLIRSAGLSLMVAFAVYVWISYPKIRRIRLYLIMLSPYIISKVFSFKSESSFSYASMVSDKLSLFNSFGDVISHMTAHVGRFIQAWFNIFGVTTNAGAVLLGIVGILSIFGLINRIKNKHFDGLYLLFYILMLLLWPFSPEAERYLYPVIAIMIVHAVYMVHLGKKYLKSSVPLKLFFTAAILINNMPALALTYTRYAADIPDEYIAYRHTATWYGNEKQAGLRTIAIKKAITEAMQAIKQAVSENQCVYSIKPSIVGMFSGRVSIQTPLEKLSDQDFMKEVTEKGCQFFFVLPFRSISYRTPFYPARRIKGLADQVFTVKNDSTIYAVLYKLSNGVKQPKIDADSSSIK